MNKFFLCLFFSMAFFTASSQKIYFVYLQTEPVEPFFVKMNDKVYSSAASGYLILSRLRDTTYKFTVGFPQNKYPESNFSLTINGKDHGYLLKNFGQKGWGLFDLQTLSVQMPIVAMMTDSAGRKRSEVSAFASILSKAADDPSLRERPLIPEAEEKKTEIIAIIQPKKEVIKPDNEKKAEEKKPDLVKSDIKKDTQMPVDDKKTTEKVTGPVTLVQPKKEDQKPVDEKKVDDKKLVQKSNTEVITKEPKMGEQKLADSQAIMAVSKEEVIEKKAEDKKPMQVYKPSIVLKKSESSTTEGFGLVYIDQYENGTKDTIRLLIPNQKTAVPEVKQQPREERKFLDISSDTTADKKKVADIDKVNARPTEMKSVKKDSSINSALKNKCQVVAEESDFFKLRKIMAGEEGDDNMVNEARNYFKTKCFMTAQIKNLGALFLTDAGKFKFFEAANPYVADAENFNSLQTELKEEYYVIRFKAMLHILP